MVLLLSSFSLLPAFLIKRRSDYNADESLTCWELRLMRRNEREVMDQGHFRWQRLARGRGRSRSLTNARGRTRKRNDRGLRWFFSVVAADSQPMGWGGLLECIMHAKWRGFLQITGAAPLPDEGVLRWRRGSLPTFSGWSFSSLRSVRNGSQNIEEIISSEGPVSVQVITSLTDWYVGTYDAHLTAVVLFFFFLFSLIFRHTFSANKGKLAYIESLQQKITPLLERSATNSSFQRAK